MMFNSFLGGRAFFGVQHRNVSTAIPKKSPTGIVMMNLGGPSTQEEVSPFLHRLFSDRDLIQLPFQKWSSVFIAKRRTPKIMKQYMDIGGGSPLRSWTEKQGELLVKLLDEKSPHTAPHKYYMAFRYAAPLTEETLTKMKEDGIKRAVAFSQYPQYSCSTTGSSLNELWRKLRELKLQDHFEWSVVDRWATHPGLIKAFAKKVREALNAYPENERNNVIILFSAHSLPMRVVNRGDSYPQEVAATVHKVMEELHFSNPYRLVWQSKVGPLPWLGPQTASMVEGLAKGGTKNMLIVPIAFTTDHIETLFELDIENAHIAKKHGATGFRRTESLNVEPIFIEGMADLVSSHLQSNQSCTIQMPVKCPGCTNESCHSSKEFFSK